MLMAVVQPALCKLHQPQLIALPQRVRTADATFLRMPHKDSRQQLVVVTYQVAVTQVLSHRSKQTLRTKPN